MTKCWGVSYGLIGDLIMGLPVLNLYEIMRPGSYKYWAIEKKVSQCAPLFINQPLIDKIVISKGWEKFSDGQLSMASSCDVQSKTSDLVHDDPLWFNKRCCVEETARVAGFPDIKGILSERLMTPHLDRWFPVKTHTEGYSQSETLEARTKKKVGIYPFANYAKCPERSPSAEWWRRLVQDLSGNNYEVHHFGWVDEEYLVPSVNYHNHTDRSYFEQVQMALDCDIVLGTDSGSMWVMGAYEQPAIHLMTNWWPGHTDNFMALEPINDKGTTFFEEGGCDNISTTDVLECISKQVG